MIVTIDEARVGHPSIKLDSMELSGMISLTPCTMLSMKSPRWSWNFYLAPIWPRSRPFWTTRM